MNLDQIQSLCTQGQDQLSRMQYLAAEKSLAAAEQLAWNAKDWDSLSRLYMPLQESRRQRRQRCGEGTIRLDLLADNPGRPIHGKQIVQDIRQGQLLIAGWQTIQPAIEARQAQAESALYVDVFLAAVHPAETGRKIFIYPTPDASLPNTPHRLEISEAQLAGAKTYEDVMDIWEWLHAPFLAAADATPDPIARIAAYRQTIVVDYACELAHQKLADTARQLSIKVTS
jgi:hypothetical protein